MISEIWPKVMHGHQQDKQPAVRVYTQKFPRVIPQHVSINSTHIPSHPHISFFKKDSGEQRTEKEEAQDPELIIEPQLTYFAFRATVKEADRPLPPTLWLKLRWWLLESRRRWHPSVHRRRRRRSHRSSVRLWPPRWRIDWAPLMCFRLRHLMSDSAVSGLPFSC